MRLETINLRAVDGGSFVGRLVSSLGDDELRFRVTCKLPFSNSVIEDLVVIHMVLGDGGRGGDCFHRWLAAKPSPNTFSDLRGICEAIFELEMWPSAPYF